MKPLLSFDQVSIRYGSFVAVDGVSLDIQEGECLALVGESGSGKTTLARAALGLQTISSGEVRLMGHAIQGTRRGQASEIGIVWQDPYASLDPRWTIGRIIEEPGVLAKVEVDVPALMEEVGLDPSLHSRYPHQLSGGQRQRVAIARAIALKPKVLICDEPTAALDLSVQAQILNLLKDLLRMEQLTCLYISHDLATVRYIADRVAVLKSGRLVESGAIQKVFEDPQESYTRELLSSAPRLLM